MLNQSLRIRLLVLGLLIFSVNIISAQEDDNLGTEVVNIINHIIQPFQMLLK